MQRAFLINEMNGQKIEVRGSLVAGRTRECDLVIDDSAASRRHIEITPRNGGYVWKDLGSTNGTIVNGSRMLAGELRSGDTIQIGETVMRFQVDGAAEDTREEGRLFQETIMDDSGHVVAKPGPSNTSALLEAVYTVANEIATNYEPCSLLDRVLETTVSAIKAQRGAVFLSGEQGALLPCPVCGQVHCLVDGVLRPAAGAEILISESIVRRVLRGGESVLYQDTDHDTSLNMSASIISLDLRSILCVPLRAKHGILGVLYIDTNRPGQKYTHDDLLLASAVGNSAGLALENAQMHLQILEKQRIEQEIATAWTIQEGFLIKDWTQTDPSFDVYGETRPAKTVGGDFYDFVRIDEHTVGVLVGDVSGKGVPAALTMAQLLAEFRLLARESMSPAEVLRQLNVNLVHRSRRGLFCSVCYYTLDLRTGLVTASNAGHPPVLRIATEGATLLAEAGGPPLGILAAAQWGETQFTLQPGETLVLYTDGIVEARSGATQSSSTSDPIEFDTSGLVQTGHFLQGKDARSVTTEIYEAVRQFTAPHGPHDDCTLIVLRYIADAG